MKPMGEELTFQLSSHIDLLHTDQARLLGYILKLEHLLEDYRTFIMPLSFASDEKHHQHTGLLRRTSELLGEEQASTPAAHPGISTSGLYLFEVDRDNAEKKRQKQG